MKTKYINGMAASAALLLLVACGKRETTTENAPDGDEAEITAAITSSNRDWMPAEIILPQPHTVIQDTKIGTRSHLLQVVVENDPKGKFPQWKAALEAAGYKIDERMLSDGRLLFQGAGIEGGQIAVLQTEDQKGYVIQIDISKDSQ